MSLICLFCFLFCVLKIVCSQYEECTYQSQWIDCPGTANARIEPIHQQISVMDLNGESFYNIRRELVSACGLEMNVRGTSHCFADWTHVDCCPVITQHSTNTNEYSRIPGMHRINDLSSVISKHSIPIGGDRNGSWCTCSHGAPRDVCHAQFGSMIAFKAVWCPNESSEQYKLMLIDNDGNLLNVGLPIDQPNAYTKAKNWEIITKSKNSEFRMDITALCRTVWKSKVDLETDKHEL